jgi:hypothetical protein
VTSRIPPIALAVLPLFAACHKGSSAGDESSSTAAAESSSDDGFTGDIPFECMAIGEFFFEDGVGLGAISIDAVYTTVDAESRYDVYIHGDDTDLTQVVIGFIGTPAIDLDYAASIATAPNKPIVTLYPDIQGSPTLVGGIVTYKQVGVMTGDTLEMELQLQLTSGLLRGCVSAEIVASGG